VVPFSVFQPDNETRDHSYGTGLGPGNPLTTICVIAPVLLPDGVTINRFDMYVRDLHATQDFSFSLRRIPIEGPFAGLDEPDPLASINTSGSSVLARKFSDTGILNGLYQRSQGLTLVRPVAQSDGHDPPRLIDEAVPGLAGGIDDLVVGFEDAVREVGLAQELPEVLDGVQLGRPGGQEEQRDVAGDLERGRGVPSGAVEQEDGMSAGRDPVCDLVEMSLHGRGVGPGQGERGAGAARGADGAEEIEAVIALVLGLARPRAFPGPLPHQAVLLAQAHLVLPPELDRHLGRQVAYGRGKRAREVFLKSSSTSAFCAGWRARALRCAKPSSWSSRDTERS